MKIQLSKNEIVETDDLTIDEMDALRQHLLDRMLEMDGKITEARRKAAEEGVYADRDWWNRIRMAKRKMGEAAQKVQMAISHRRKNERAQVRASLTESFMAVCRKRMPPELFAEVLEQAEAHYKAMQVQDKVLG